MGSESRISDYLSTIYEFISLYEEIFRYILQFPLMFPINLQIYNKRLYIKGNLCIHKMILQIKP